MLLWGAPPCKQPLLQHGYLVLFVAVFLEQFGVPIPSAPVLLAAGALADHGALSLSAALLLSILASLMGDLIWYKLGRSRGRGVLKLICRISLEPDSCVRSTEDIFARYGGRALLLAKFIPGLGVAIPPMAGLLRMSWMRFLLLDIAGAALWVCTFSGIGYLFSEQIEDIALLLARLGSGALVLAIGSLAGYLVWKYLQRRRFFRRLSIARVAPEELMRKLKDGEKVMIIDLRHNIQIQADNTLLPGAIRMEPGEVEQQQHKIPRDRDVILYCT